MIGFQSFQLNSFLAWNDFLSRDKSFLYHLLAPMVNGGEEMVAYIHTKIRNFLLELELMEVQFSLQDQFSSRTYIPKLHWTVTKFLKKNSLNANCVVFNNHAIRHDQKLSSFFNPEIHTSIVCESDHITFCS